MYDVLVQHLRLTSDTLLCRPLSLPRHEAYVRVYSTHCQRQSQSQSLLYHCLLGCVNGRNWSPSSKQAVHCLTHRTIGGWCMVQYRISSGLLSVDCQQAAPVQALEVKRTPRGQESRASLFCSWSWRGRHVRSCFRSFFKTDRLLPAS